MLNADDIREFINVADGAGIKYSITSNTFQNRTYSIQLLVIPDLQEFTRLLGALDWKADYDVDSGWHFYRRSGSVLSSSGRQAGRLPAPGSPRPEPPLDASIHPKDRRV